MNQERDNESNYVRKTEKEKRKKKKTGTKIPLIVEHLDMRIAVLFPDLL